MIAHVPTNPLRPFIINLWCLAAATIVYATCTMIILDNNGFRLGAGYAADKISMAPLRKPTGQSHYVKSNQFMLKDAICNFTNGNLVCHRAVRLQRPSSRFGS